MEWDAALVQQVKAELSGRTHLDLQRVPIAVGADGGVVALRGTVETLRDKRHAEAIARAVPGVKDVASALRLDPLANKSDEAVARAVRNALEADRSIDETAIDVRAEDGVVTLRGLVGTLMQRRLAVATVWWLTGVQDVRDELQVLYPEEDNDDELRDACHILLDKDPIVDAAEVSVLAEDGVVTLAGAVGSEVARDAAENTIWGILGVKHVHNHLLVVPGGLPARERELGR